MCYYVDQKATRAEVKRTFKVEVKPEQNFLQAEFIKGFDYPALPIITNDKPNELTTNTHWGLMPSWAGTQQLDYRNGKLNARIEEIHEKPSYKYITQNRCLIVATGFYEWRWLDPKGKRKEKYFIASQTDEIFCFAGLYDSWVNPANGDVLKTFTMVTTHANELMRYIHNHKERMPIILNREDEQRYLDPATDISQFALPYESKIIGFKI